MATSPEAIRRGLTALAGAAVAEVLPLLRPSRPDASRAALLEAAPEVTAGYVLGSSALAADWYDELREEARPRTRHLTIVPEWQRAEKYGRALAWATEPLAADVVSLDEARSRLSVVTEYEVFGGFTETTTANLRQDADARGWKRNARGDACKLCQMLASRGAVYRAATARFATHTNCRCVAVPTFGSDDGPEASVMQYQASKRRRTDADRARLRSYLNEHFPDARG